MAEQMLAARSAVAHWTPVRTQGLSIDVRDDLTIASVAADRNKSHELKALIRSNYGLDLPNTPTRVAGDGIAFCWAGPDQWMAIAERGCGRDLERELVPLVSRLAAVVDQSDGRAVITISGRRARDVLAKGLPIDLHPAAFRANDIAITHAHHIGVTLCQLDATPTYQLIMFRSFADSFAQWLRHAATEFIDV